MALLIVLVISVILPIFPLNRIDAMDIDKTIVISEIQTGGIEESGSEDGRQEFIELHNQTFESVDISGWKLQYFSASREDVQDGSASPTRELVLLDGSVDMAGYILFSFHGYIENADGYFGEGSTAASGLLARTGGHIRVIDESGFVIDLVAWGSAKIPETKSLPEIEAGFTASRKIDDNNPDLLVDEDDNFNDFIISAEPTPEGGSLIENEIIEELEPVIPPCDGLTITEIMPNPEGSDAGHEFIELYNPGETTVFLEDCILKTSANTKQFMFSIGSTIGPKSYRVLYNSETNLTLFNASGGEVLLIGTLADYSVQYPEDMEADHAWAMIDGVWYETDHPTPGTQNKLPTPEVESAIDEEVQLTLCPPGKFRNPETNRCKNIQTTVASLVPCNFGQVRNPETNRCRSVASLVSSLVPCRPGQERNPETNRCRNVLGATASQTPCQEGYERNPATNRCRKQSITSPASPSVGSASKSASSTNLPFIIATSIVVLGYGAYEYRRDLVNALTRLKTRGFMRRIK